MKTIAAFFIVWSQRNKNIETLLNFGTIVERGEFPLDLKPAFSLIENVGIEMAKIAWISL